MHNITGVYKLRNPQESDCFQCAQDLFEELEMFWEDRYERRCEFWRPYVKDVILRYLDCGDLYNGFARVNDVPALMDSGVSRKNFRSTILAILHETLLFVQPINIHRWENRGG